MKKIVLLSMLAGFVGLFSSCTSTDQKETRLQTPLKNESQENQVNKQASADAKAKTIADLLDAFKGETNASAKYAAYSEKAEQEGYHNIALLFKAASMAENVHANNHKSVLIEYGATVPAITPEYTVKTTSENLLDAIEGESYEVATMYPEFLQDASSSKSQLAQISFNYAYEVEKKHQVMYQDALIALKNNTIDQLSQVYYICPTCGNTYDNTPSERCGLSMSSSEKFFKIDKL